jgi:hypothetical protein
MRLSLKDQLDAEFLVIVEPGTYRRQPDKAGAHGVKFLCPKCFAVNGGPVGTHSVICWSRSSGTPEDMQPGPGRWKMDGTGLDDLTLNGDAPDGGGARSVLLTGGCGWHGFVDDGYAHGDIPG